MSAQQTNCILCYWLRFSVTQVLDGFRLPRLRLPIYTRFESSQMCIPCGDSQVHCGDSRLPLQASSLSQNITALINPPLDAQGTHGKLSGPLHHYDFDNLPRLRVWNLGSGPPETSPRRDPKCVGFRHARAKYPTKAI